MGILRNLCDLSINDVESEPTLHRLSEFAQISDYAHISEFFGFNAPFYRESGYVVFTCFLNIAQAQLFLGKSFVDFVEQIFVIHPNICHTLFRR